MLVPQKPNLSDLHDLEPDDLAMAMEDVRNAANCLQKLTDCTKINVGSLGNMVRQLHIHVIARKEGDANWPGPVWGFEKAIPYGSNERSQFISNIEKELF
jgi:diadenosine tetraphosphate (Ap4A) HIT family hydrolase